MKNFWWWVALTVAVAATESHATESNATPSILDHLLLIEAEQCVDVAGTPIVGPRGARSAHVFYNGDDQSSGGGFITPLPPPYRNLKPFPEPVEAKTEVEIPIAGRWYVHVRYRVSPSRTAKRGVEFRPFRVAIGGQSFSVATNQVERFDLFADENRAEGAEFRWDKFAVELPVGRTTVKFLMPGLAAPDCLLLSPAADYSPDFHDSAGPVWLRFKVIKGAKNPFSIFCKCIFNPYEEKQAKTAGELFKDGAVKSWDQGVKIQHDPQRLLNTGEWSPWVKTFTATKKYFFAEAEIIPGAEKSGFDDIEVAYEAATRPEAAFVIHRGVEPAGNTHAIYILLPTTTGLEAMRREVRSFSEWGAARIAFVKQLGLQPGEGPRRIQVGAMLTSVNAPGEVDAFLEVCRRVGFNGCEIGHVAGDTTAIWQQIEKDGFTWTHAHHLAPAYEAEQWLELPATPPAGQTMQQVVDAFWYGRSLKRVRSLWENRPQRKLVDLANLVDEPGAMPSFVWANQNPAVKLCFHDFLRTNGLTPEVFGKKTWDDVNLAGYLSKVKSGTAKRLTQMNLDVEFVAPSSKSAKSDNDSDPLTATIMQPAADDPDLLQITEPKDKANRQKVQIQLTQGLPVASPEEKRQYYWTQRFRSYFTRHFYGQTAHVIEDLSRQGWLRAGVKASPNFQAAPMMETRMWDGGLDLFEWARDGTSNCLMMEDWINDHYRVSFGLSVLEAAARKRGQTLGFLIVADRYFRQRYLTGLAVGVRTFADYVYGPLATIGPTWASSPEGVSDRAEMFRWTRRCEDDLLASHRRPAETALLVANSSEINTTFYNACAAETGLRFAAAGGRSLFRRAGIYASLLDNNVSTEITSETGIIEDKELDRFKALYVTDTHVATAVQEAIKTWVRNGGTLWADYTALARNEFDEDSSVMNEVFGLAKRGSLPGSAQSKEEDEEVARVTAGAVEEVESTLVTGKTKGKDAAPEKIQVAAGGKMEAVGFDGSNFRPAWQLSTGKALATFADGSPALVVNQYGKGQAVLLGCSALMLGSIAKQSQENPEFAKVQAVVRLGAELAGAGQPCRVSVPRVNAYVRDGTNQTVLVLINSTEAQQTRVDFRLTVPHEVKSAFDGRGRAVAFQQQGSEIKFARDLAVNDGDIVVFKW